MNDNSTVNGIAKVKFELRLPEEAGESMVSHAMAVVMLSLAIDAGAQRNFNMGFCVKTLAAATLAAFHGPHPYKDKASFEEAHRELVRLVEKMGAHESAPEVFAGICRQAVDGSAGEG